METFISEEWNHSWTIVTSSLSSLCTEMFVCLYFKKKGVLFTQLHRLPPADFNRMLSLSTFNLYMPDTVKYISMRTTSDLLGWVVVGRTGASRNEGYGYGYAWHSVCNELLTSFHCECNCLCVSLRACVRQKRKDSVLQPDMFRQDCDMCCLSYFLHVWHI